MANPYFVAIRSSEYPDADGVWFYQTWTSRHELKKILDKVIAKDNFYVARVVRAKSGFRPACSDSEYFRTALSTMHKNVEKVKKEKRKEKMKRIFEFFMRPETAYCQM